MPLAPCGQASPELIQFEQADPPVAPHRRAHLWRVVAPSRQEQRHVRQIGMGGDVLEGVEPVFDEP